MKQEIQVPPMGESISEATVGVILKENGSIVNMDEEILELETDKVNQVLYAPKGGLVEWSVSVDDTVQVGQVIGYIDTTAAPAPSEKKEAPKAKEDKKETPKPTSPPAPKATVAKGAARMTVENYIQEVKSPSTPSSQPQATPFPSKPRGETRHRMTKIRKVIAKRLVEAQQTAAMLTTFNEIDMSEVMKLRTLYKESFLAKHGVKLGFMSFFVKACISALQAIPDINSYIDSEEIVERNYFDIGIAVGTERGLVVPVLRDCDQMSFAQVEQQIMDFAMRARKGGLRVDDLQGGGFTITNGGIYGSMLSTPILNAPQSGILGMHNIVKRAVVVNDEIVIRPMMYVALSYDHRIVDGKGAVTFLVHIKKLLEEPACLLLDVQ